ncbi:MAG: hypothetical protein IRY99_14740 [Isosphaeraceae bacterium]|nr:hypothetical protein [Isosphaeraceae bacterium]
MRRLATSLLLLSVICALAGCGGASGIEPGIPRDAAQGPPPGFDPGGDATPDMTGKKAAPGR